MERLGCFIDGRWVETKERLQLLSPWSGEVVGEAALAGPGEWEAAISRGPTGGFGPEGILQPGAPGGS